MGLINASLERGTPLLEPEKEIHERILLFRLGKIEIIVTADASNAEKITRTENAIVLFAICILIP